MNYKILTRHESVKKRWEERLNVTLPDGAEVWSKPEKEKEILNYVQKRNQQNKEPQPSQ